VSTCSSSSSQSMARVHDNGFRVEDKGFRVEGVGECQTLKPNALTIPAPHWYSSAPKPLDLRTETLEHRVSSHSDAHISAFDFAKEFNLMGMHIVSFGRMP
jgi:hypothetical protein